MGAVFGAVGAQMAWVLWPFIGNPHTPFAWFRPVGGKPHAPAEFLRPEKWDNAYAIVAHMAWRAVGGQ